jgi:hypothetical protein
MDQVFDGQSADGNSSEVSIASSVETTFFFVLSGTFGGGSVKPQVSPDGGTTWVDCKEVYQAGAISATAAGMYPFLARGTALRLNLSGSTSPDLDAWLGR